MREMAGDVVAEQGDLASAALDRSGQRGWNGQPGGGSIGFGGSPPTGVRARPLIARSGTASSSMRV